MIIIIKVNNNKGKIIMIKVNDNKKYILRSNIGEVNKTAFFFLHKHHKHLKRK